MAREPTNAELISTLRRGKKEPGVGVILKKEEKWFLPQVQFKLNLNEPYHKIGYFKARELYKLVGGNPRTFFFNAELPGGFMFAAREYYGFSDESFLGSSFYPPPEARESVEEAAGVTKTQSFLLDIYGALKNNEDRWVVGLTKLGGRDLWSTGDMTKAVSIHLVVWRVLDTLGKVDLYTSDGGIDVEEGVDPEAVTARLKAGEAITGLQTVAEGGTMILKIFGALRVWTQYLVVLLTGYFDNVRLYKPVLSRATNSELYVVCTRRNNRELRLTGEQVDEFLDLAGSDDILERQPNFLARVSRKHLRGVEKVARDYNNRMRESIKFVLQVFGTINRRRPLKEQLREVRRLYPQVQKPEDYINLIQ